MGPYLLKVRALYETTAVELLEMMAIENAFPYRMLENHCRGGHSRYSLDKQESKNCLFWKTVGETGRKEHCCHVVLGLALSQDGDESIVCPMLPGTWIENQKEPY